MRQIITPNPDIPCRPGWCLQYVRQAFGLAGVYPSATAGWNASPTQHRDWSFPAGCWVPVWFGLAGEPLGHVALLAPDGSVYSTSDNSTVPHHHPDMADLLAYYAAADLPLTFRGWTEDIEGVAVVDGTPTIAPAGTITPQEDDMTPEQMLELKLFIQNEIERRHVVTRDLIRAEGFSFENKVFIQEAVEARALVTRDVIRTAVATLASFTPGIDSGKLEEALRKAVSDAVTAGVKVDVSITGGK